MEFVSDYDSLHDEVVSVTAEGDLLTSRKANALSTKLASVLSFSYADSETQEALRLLDLRNLYSPQNASQSLKANVQKEVIDINTRIINDFGQVAEQLNQLGAMISTLNATCAEMRTHITLAAQESQPVLEEASTLLARKAETESKQQLLAAFRKHFIISDEDLNTLTNTTIPLNESFFTVLNRVKAIHRDCSILLGYENQRLGLELMEQTTRNIDAGFSKLYSWIKREFKGLDLEDPRMSASIRRALRVLSERPTLFQNCLEFFAEARESTLSQAFQDALTGQDEGRRKAIEFSTHDVLRYVGDMLAWVHSTAVSEKEALEGLFVGDAEEISRGMAAGRASEPWARIRHGSNAGQDLDQAVEDDEETVFDGRKALSDLISRNLVGVCQTLYSRVEVAVRNAGDPVLTYKAYNLLTFYRDIFAKLVGSDTSISKTTLQLESFTMARFEEEMEEEIATATADNTPPADLSPPTFLHTGLKQFSDVSKARGPQMTTSELERLFSTMVTGVLDACAEGAMQLADHRASHIYKINYIATLHSTLKNLTGQVPSLKIPLEKADAEMEALKGQLIDSTTSIFLEESGVGELLQEMDSRQDLAIRKTWLAENLEAVALKLDEFLSSGLMDAQDSLRAVIDKSFASHVVAQAVENFCAEFAEVESMLGAVDGQQLHNGIEDGDESQDISLREMYPRTVAEVKALLS